MPQVQIIQGGKSRTGKLAESLGESLGQGLGSFLTMYGANKSLDKVLNNPQLQNAPMSQRLSALETALRPYGEYGQNILKNRLAIEAQGQQERTELKETERAKVLWNQLNPDKPYPGLPSKEIIELEKIKRKAATGQTGKKGGALTPEESQMIPNILNANKNATPDELQQAFDLAGISRDHSAPYIQNRRQSTKPKPKSEFEKTLEKKSAASYFEAKESIPKIESSLQNIQYLRQLASGPLSGIGGSASALFNTKSAAEFNALAPTLLEPIIKVFNPVGAVPVSKLNWIRDTFSPKAGELKTTQMGKLNTLERISQQAIDRANKKVDLYQEYDGNPPESEIMKFDNESAQQFSNQIDNLQYIEKLKNEVPEGKILMLDNEGKPLFVDPNQKAPDGSSAVEYIEKNNMGRRVQ